MVKLLSDPRPSPTVVRQTQTKRSTKPRRSLLETTPLSLSISDRISMNAAIMRFNYQPYAWSRSQRTQRERCYWLKWEQRQALRRSVISQRYSSLALGREHRTWSRGVYSWEPFLWHVCVCWAEPAACFSPALPRCSRGLRALLRSREKRGFLQLPR